MSFIKELSPEEHDLLISLPYRIGVWIAHVDDIEGTKLDEKRERQALEYAIQHYRKAGKKMPFVAYIMGQVEHNKGAWPSWAQRINEDEILSDVRQAIELCKGKGKVSILNQYRRLIWQIATIVAQAYGEQIDPDNEMHVDRFFAWIGSFLGPPRIKKVPENMSPKEKSALQKLRAVLKDV